MKAPAIFEGLATLEHTSYLHILFFLGIRERHVTRSFNAPLGCSPHSQFLQFTPVGKGEKKAKACRKKILVSFTWLVDHKVTKIGPLKL